MADGDPYQPSHFRNQTARIGVMAPTLAAGVTLWPDFYWEADLAIFDAIGWDYVASIAGDLDGDGCVDLADLVVLLSDFECIAADCVGDLDADGDTDLTDLVIQLGNFGQCSP